jgi:hypothetical protein
MGPPSLKLWRGETWGEDVEELYPTGKGLIDYESETAFTT